MKITGRHLVVTPALRQHIESRFERLARYEVKLGHLEVILIEDAKHRLAPLPGSLVVFTALSSEKLQTLQRVDGDRVVLIDP